MEVFDLRSTEQDWVCVHSALHEHSGKFHGSLELLKHTTTINNTNAQPGGSLNPQRTDCLHRLAASHLLT
jgi:hypothetical protein